MVAKITTPQSIVKALNYNEKKVGQGKAESIYAGNFLKDAGQLNFYDKLHHFQQQIALNERTKINTLHISLNFDPSESLSKDRLTEIAGAYMEKIGFSKQPYLVYEHRDAGHPHMHIVTTNIQADGRRIPIHNIGRSLSSKARVEIENEFGLVKAAGRNKGKDNEIQPVSTQKAQYGKGETKQSITSVLDVVLPLYKYTSIAELNAVLKLYNVRADQGSKEGRIYKNRGLVYRILDEKGNPIGVPVKASAIHSKPTLDNLEKKFGENKLKRQPHEKRLKTVLDWTLAKHPKGLGEFKAAVEKEKVLAVVRQNEHGFIYGLTFIDHQTRCVFNGSDLGKPYSAKAVLERCGQQTIHLQPLSNSIRQQETGISKTAPVYNGVTPLSGVQTQLQKAFEAIMTPEQQNSYLPSELKGKKRKKKRKISHN